MVWKEVKQTIIEERKGFGYKPKIQFGKIDEIDEFLRSHKQKKRIVKEVLTNEDARNSDTILVLESWRVDYPDIQIKEEDNNLHFIIPKKLLKYLTSPETYTRARRELTNQAYKEALETNNFKEWKKLIPTKQSVIIERMKREKNLKEYFGKQ